MDGARGRVGSRNFGSRSNGMDGERDYNNRPTRGGNNGFYRQAQAPRQDRVLLRNGHGPSDWTNNPLKSFQSPPLVVGTAQFCASLLVFGNHLHIYYWKRHFLQVYMLGEVRHIQWFFPCVVQFIYFWPRGVNVCNFGPNLLLQCPWLLFIDHSVNVWNI